MLRSAHARTAHARSFDIQNTFNPHFSHRRLKAHNPERIDLERECRKRLGLLHERGMIRLHQGGSHIEVLPGSKVMAFNYLRFNTVARFVELPPSSGLPGLIGVLTTAEEFADIRIRRGEKGKLNRVIKACCSEVQPEDGKVKTPADKLGVLLQLALTDNEDIKIDDVRHGADPQWGGFEALQTATDLESPFKSIANGRPKTPQRLPKVSQNRSKTLLSMKLRILKKYTLASTGAR